MSQRHRYIRNIDNQSTCHTVDMGVERVVCYSSKLPVSTCVPGCMRQASILSVLDGRPGGPGQFRLVLQTPHPFQCLILLVRYGRYFDNL